MDLEINQGWSDGDDFFEKGKGEVNDEGGRKVGRRRWRREDE